MKSNIIITYLAAIFLLIYLVSCSVYLYGLSTGALNLPFLRSLIWSNIAFIMISSIILDLYTNSKSITTIHYINSTRSVVAVTAIIAVLINIGILKYDPYWILGSFYLGILIATLIIVSRDNKNYNIK